jgi:signal transduction protein with GAF and PtsI domain
VTSETSREMRPPFDERGVDRTQIRAMLRMTPTERLRFLVRTVANLRKLRRHARRV